MDTVVSETCRAALSEIKFYDFKTDVHLVGFDIYMSKGYFIIVWRWAPSRQIVTSELVSLLLALTLEHVT
jgi:hypothetical protein